MEIVTHVLTSEQKSLRRDPTRQKIARDNIKAVSGAKVKGEQECLPVDENGIIEIPSGTVVGEGTLTITDGNEVLGQFGANQATDTTIVIDISGKADKVDNAADGHLAGLDGNGNLTDSGLSIESVSDAIDDSHTHDNKDILDDVTAPYTTEEQAKLDGKADKVSGATPSNFAGLDSNGNLTDSGSKATDFATAAQGALADTAYQKPGEGIPKNDLAPGVKDSLDLADSAVQPADLDVYALKSEMSVTDGSGADADKVTIQLKAGTSTTVLKSHQDITVKADKVSGATNGNFAGLDANGNLTDSGSKASDFATAAQGAKADSAIQGISVNGTAVNPDANKNVAISIPKSVPDPSASNQMLFSVDGSTWVPMTWETISFNTVTIGGKQYTTATVGGQIWLVGNLDLTWDGLVPSEAGKAYLNEPRANYYSDDESTYGWNGKKYGLLYNWAAVRYMDEHANTLFEGWHVPTSDEWNTLKQSLGASGAYELMTTTEWTAGNGSDLYGFSAVPSGIRGASPSYAYGGNGARANFWTKTHPGDSQIVATMWTMRGDTGAFYYDAGAFKDTQGSVRLVKDV